jgi:hypothetical protein
MNDTAVAEPIDTERLKQILGEHLKEQAQILAREPASAPWGTTDEDE